MLKNVSTLPCTYDFNKKAWMTGDLFIKWLRKVDQQMGLQKRKIAMIVDNCIAHPKSAQDRVKNIKQTFLAS